MIYGAYQLHPWTFVVRIKNGRCSETVEGRYWAGRIVTEASLKQLIARSDIFQLCPTSPPPTYSSCHYKAITNTSVVANYHLQIITANFYSTTESHHKKYPKTRQEKENGGGKSLIFVENYWFFVENLWFFCGKLVGFSWILCEKSLSKWYEREKVANMLVENS